MVGLKGWFASLAVGVLMLAASSSAFAQRYDIVVTNTTELEDAADPSNANKRILIKAGTYFPSESLRIPEKATWEGEGVMGGDELPAGFVSGDTVIAWSSGMFLTGRNPDRTAVVYLSHLSTIRWVTVTAAGAPNANAIIIDSEAPGTTKNATIEEVVAVSGGNDSNSAISARITLTDPATADDGASVGATINRSILGGGQWCGLCQCWSRRSRPGPCHRERQQRA